MGLGGCQIAADLLIGEFWVGQGKLLSELDQYRLKMEKCRGKVAAGGFGFPPGCGNIKWNRNSRPCVEWVEA